MEPAGPDGDQPDPAVSETNAVAATVGLVSPLAVGLVTALGLTWRPALAFTIPGWPALPCG